MNTNSNLIPQYFVGKGVTRLQLAEWYGISTKTFCRMLKTRGIILPPGIITPKDVERIFSVIGYPKLYHKLIASSKILQ